MSAAAGQSGSQHPSMTDLVRAVAIMAFYFLAGPPIGFLLVIAILLIATAIEGGSFAEMFSDLAGFDVWTLPLLVYLVGGTYALVTGLLVGVCYVVARTRSVVAALLAPIVAVYPGTWLSGGPIPSFPPGNSDLVFIGFGIAASLLCWAVLRLVLTENRR